MFEEHIQKAKALYHQDKALFAVAIIYSVLFAGFFFMDTDLHRNVFYLSLPFSLMLIFRHADEIKFCYTKKKSVILPVILFLSYLALSLLWSETTEEGREFDKAKILIFLPVSMLTVFLMVRKNNDIYDWFVGSFVAGAFISAVYLILEYYITADAGRLEGMGRAENSVMAGYLYSIALLALVCHKGVARLAWTYRAPIAAILLAVMLLTLSRGPLLALAVSTVAVMIYKKQYMFVASGVLLIAICVITILASGARQYIPIINRGDTGRPQVWEQTIENIREKPIFGHGIGSKFFYTYKQGRGVEKASHPHSLYFSTLVQGGVVGLILLLWVQAMLFCKSIRLAQQTGELWPFATIVTCYTLGLYDFGGAYTNMNVMWLSLWLQIALITAMEKPKTVV